MLGPYVENPNKHGLIGGLINSGETLKEGICRETAKEVGLTVNPNDLHLVHTMHSTEDNQETVGYYFLVEKWDGEPYNKASDKHVRIEWLEPKNLPQDLIARNKQAIECWQKGITYSEYGWYSRK